MSHAEILTKKYKTLLRNHGITTPLRLAHFFAQCYAESGLKTSRENMNYSAKRLIEIFKRRLDRNRDGFLDESEKAKVRDIVDNPEKIANFVYANRMGNGDELSGDGWRYRGGGFLGLTFRNNYLTISRDTGIDFVGKPELINEEANALISALWFWSKNNLNKFADQDNLDAISDLINIGKLTRTIGDANGYQHRREALTEYKKIFKV